MKIQSIAENDKNFADGAAEKSMPNLAVIFEKFGLPVAYLIITVCALWLVYQDGKTERDKFLLLFEKQNQVIMQNTETLKVVSEKLEKLADKTDRNYDAITNRKK
jgi:hypothetical protein